MKRNRNIHRGLAALAIATLLALSPALLSAQEDDLSRAQEEDQRGMLLPQEQQQGAVFGERLEVNVVNVFVTVTDKDGNPMLGLPKEAFEIYEDGNPVEISNYYEVRSERWDKPVQQQLEERPPSGIPAPVPEIRPEEQRHVVVFIDNLHMEQRNRAEVFKGLRSFVAENIRTDDQVMLVSFYNQLEIAQGFTNSPGDIVAAIDKLEKVPAEGTRTENSRMQLIRDLEAIDLAPAQTAGPTGLSVAGMSSGAKVASSERRMYMAIDNLARETHNRGVRTISALRYMMSSMAGLPGRKMMIYVSDGLQIRPEEALFHAHYNRFQNAAEVYGFAIAVESPTTAVLRYDLTRDYQRLLEHAQANQVIFSAIDSAGRRRYTQGADRNIRDSDSYAIAEYSAAWDQRLDTLHEDNLHSPLQMVARGTGGAVMMGGRAYDDYFRSLKNNFDNYYSLGFMAPHAKEGNAHKIEVKVKADGARVYFQSAYLDKTWNDFLADRTVSDLVLGVGQNPLDIVVATDEPTPKDKKYLLPVAIFVPIRNLTLVPQGKEEVGNASIVLTVKDRNGNTTPPYTAPLAVRVPQDQVEAWSGRMAEAQINLLVDAGQQKIAVGVRDEVTGTMSTATTEVIVGHS
jgi:VWFA-related protein